jgi:hypothetical protein
VSVYEEIKREIEDLRVSGTSPGMAAAALALAGAIDLPSTGATAAANAVAQLRMVMSDLRELAPVENAGDSLDEIAAKRRERRAG